MTTVILDSEAITALRKPASAKGRAVLAALEVVPAQRKRRRINAHAIVPTTVRVEAHWNRRDPAAATLNRLPILDSTLTSDIANHASDIVESTGVSVADAHIAALVATSGQPAVVVTSDPRDIERASAPHRVRVIRL
ncbi:MAG: hypothetical protein WCP26_14180 [Actinomycetes bacterium]